MLTLKLAHSFDKMSECFKMQKSVILPWNLRGISKIFLFFVLMNVTITGNLHIVLSVVSRMLSMMVNAAARILNTSLIALWSLFVWAQPRSKHKIPALESSNGEQQLGWAHSIGHMVCRSGLFICIESN
jgi:hypothetical protein